MKNFEEVPDKEYSLFLIRNLPGLTEDILENILEQSLKRNKVISIERLFKGVESALVIYGPRSLFKDQGQSLNLLELEDYTKININHAISWEIDINKFVNARKDSQKDNLRIFKDIFKNMPKLESSEQFWWQITLKGKKERIWLRLFSGHLDKNKKAFLGQIRALVYAQDDQRRQKLSSSLQNLGSSQLIKLPMPFSSTQTAQFYTQRSLFLGKSENLTSQDIMRLLKL